MEQLKIAQQGNMNFALSEVIAIRKNFMKLAVNPVPNAELAQEKNLV